MKTVAELDTRLAALRKRRQELHYALDAARVAALDAPEKWVEAAALREEYEAFPAQVGELTRQRVLAELTAWQAEAAAGLEAWREMDARDTEHGSRTAAWRQDPRRKLPAELSAYMADGRALDAEYNGEHDAFVLATHKLTAIYSRAAAYGVGLDGSAMNGQATGHRQAGNPNLNYDAATWAAAAQREADKAREHARRYEI